jgi:peptidoglycan hydrolase-like protein with peptidoglycan-binding domain
VARRRTKRTHEEERQAPSLLRDQSGESAGPESASPQQGVARLQDAAGNEAVSGMLQRFHGGGQSAAATKQASTLRRGSRGASVEILQTQLNGAGFGPLKVDGIFGPRTQKSVRRFQGENRLVPDGVVGKKTLRKLGVEVGGPALAPTKPAVTPDLSGVKGEIGAGGGSIQATQLRALTLNNLTGADSGTRQLAGSLADAVAEAWSTWQSIATMAGVVVNAVTATGGQVIAPPLSALLVPRTAPVDPVAGLALANAIGPAFDIFASTLKMPGLPLFPSFAAVPGPVAPPTPSVPVPLVALAGAQPIPQKQFTSLTPTQRRACEAVVDAFGPTFEVWRVSTMVSVLGTGPIPTFAPPYVPVGPVVGGVANGIPGQFLR